MLENLNNNQIVDTVNTLLKKDTFGKYKGMDNSGNPKTDYLTKLVQMSDIELYKECESKIWLSAFAANNHKSDYHWHCDACYVECVRRNKENIYSQAHINAF